MSSNYYENDIELMKKAIILCHPGYFIDECYLDVLLNNMKKGVSNVSLDCDYTTHSLEVEKEGNQLALQEIEDIRKHRKDANVFVKLTFKDTKNGTIKDQANLLAKAIRNVKKHFSDSPIIVLGYDKGGLVNCRCAIKHQGIIDKIINIGTPHNGLFEKSFFNFFLDSILDLCDFKDVADSSIIQSAIETLFGITEGEFKNMAEGIITDTQLKKEWNALQNKPKFTVVAAEAFEIDGEFKGDLVVPTSSAIAEGFEGRSYEDILYKNFIVSKGKLSFKKEVLQNLGGPITDFIYRLIKKNAKGILAKTAVVVVPLMFDLVFNIATIVENIDEFLKLAHKPILSSGEFMLTNDTIALRTFAGLNA